MNKGISDLINEAIKDGACPGCCFGIIANGKCETKSYGLKAKFPKEEDNNIDTLYDMASCTKVICTTTCILKLMEQGKLRLYEPVCNILPDFKLKDITVWDLLTHTSGLIADLPGGAKMTKQELIDGINNATPVYERHTKIQYSDLNFVLLGWIVKKLSGLRLDEFSKKYVFDPLEMYDTGFNPTDTLRCAPTEDRGDHIDRGYVHDEMAHTFDGVSGHAGLFSTINDIMHFLQMVLDEGMYKGKRILSKASIELMYTPQVEDVDKISLNNEKRSVGWIVKGSFPCSGDLASKETIMHTGFTGTHVVIDRQNKVAFSLLSNRVHPTRANNKMISFRTRLGNYIFSHIEEL